MNKFSTTALVISLLCSYNTLAEGINKEVVGSGIPASKANKSLHDQLPQSIRESGVITIATDAHYPPCQSFASDNKTIVGYEPDLWNAISQKLGISYKVDSIAFDGLIPGVQSSRYDIASECISDNLEREKKVNFVVDAYATGAVYTLQENKTITSDPKSVCGMTVGIQQGFDFTKVVNDVMTPHCVAAGLPKITVNEYPSGEAVLLALYSGRVDFVLNNLAAVESIKAVAPRPIRIETNPLLPKYYNGMVVGKDNMALAKVLLAALQEVKADGSYAKIMAKWSISPLAIEEPGINLAASKPLPDPKP
ncbi:ABC transporter substrate-binding protein [Sodalis sp. dw_96]|uniref:ABC transporter substrate-binding protein n=1 Tax=Sodalis sp. dw_96 TaxID=2719794 RepID=UPI001BD22865|nr:ABC transporter substrate-binding protein [Sodalis sp. dw_96]